MHSTAWRSQHVRQQKQRNIQWKFILQIVVIFFSENNTKSSQKRIFSGFHIPGGWVKTAIDEDPCQMLASPSQTCQAFPYIVSALVFLSELVSSAELVWSGVVGLCDLSVECPPDTSAHSAHILFWPLFLSPCLDCSLLGLILFLNTWNTLNILLNILTVFLKMELASILVV